MAHASAASREGTNPPGTNAAERARFIYLVLDHPLSKSVVIGLIGVGDIRDIGFCRRSTTAQRWRLLPGASAKLQNDDLWELGWGIHYCPSLLW